MTTWYWMDADKNEHGPIAPDKLLMLIRQGEIFRDTLVRKDSSSWCRSEQINSLWDNAAKPYKLYMCVECGHQIDRPPCRCAKCARRVEKATDKIVTPNLSRLEAKSGPSKDSATKSTTTKPGVAKFGAKSSVKTDAATAESKGADSGAAQGAGTIRSIVKKAISLRDLFLPKSLGTKK